MFKQQNTHKVDIFLKNVFDNLKLAVIMAEDFSSVVKRLSRILDMDESAVQLCSGLPVEFIASVPW